MCLAVPGRITSITNAADPLSRMGKVDFGGVLKDASLAYVPEAGIGDYVIVHAGFAISRLDESEANTVFDYLQEMQELADEEAASRAPITPANQTADDPNRFRG